MHRSIDLYLLTRLLVLGLYTMLALPVLYGVNCREGRSGVGLYKIFVYLYEAVVHESIIRTCPSPHGIAHTMVMLSHDRCAMHDPPPTPLCLRYTGECSY